MNSGDAATADLPIVEGIMTTRSGDGSVNIAPMGPRVDREFSRFILRPFTSSTTYRNLKRTEQGVFHVMDDVDLLARAAIGRLDPLPELLPATQVSGVILAGACRWYELRVVELDDRQERTTIHCEVAASGRLRDFFGFNRAKHAVIEGAILATRLGIVPDAEIASEFARLAIIVDKTAGNQERQAFAFLQEYIEQRLSQRTPSC
jgi:hypothetical protein